MTSPHHFKDSLAHAFKEFLLAIFIIILVLGLIYWYTGNWPPMVVVESGSMKHGPPDESDIGVIDPGDLVFVKQVVSREDIITYLQGCPDITVTLQDNGRVIETLNHKGDKSPYTTYGEYGDVIVYYKNGYRNSVPIIHRAIMWIEYNTTTGGFDIPSLSVHGFKGNVTLHNLGYRGIELTISLQAILDNFIKADSLPHEGFITLGDHNSNYDQAGLVDIYGKTVEPVRVTWVLGKARGEIPWFGAIKLYLGDENPTDGRGREAIPAESWRGLYLTIGTIIFLAAMGDTITYLLSRKKERETHEEKDEGKNEEYHNEEEKTPIRDRGELSEGMSREKNTHEEQIETDEMKISEP